MADTAEIEGSLVGIAESEAFKTGMSAGTNNRTGVGRNPMIADVGVDRGQRCKPIQPKINTDKTISMIGISVLSKNRAGMGVIVRCSVIPNYQNLTI